MKLMKTKRGIEVIFDNSMEQKLLNIFLYNADLKSQSATVSLNLFDNLILTDKQKDDIKRFVADFTTAFMQIADRGKGCPDAIVLETDLFELYDLLPKYVVGLSFKDGIQVADLHNPISWILGED